MVPNDSDHVSPLDETLRENNPYQARESYRHVPLCAQNLYQGHIFSEFLVTDVEACEEHRIEHPHSKKMDHVEVYL